jgi:hypothetical protein
MVDCSNVFLKEIYFNFLIFILYDLTFWSSHYPELYIFLEKRIELKVKGLK